MRAALYTRALLAMLCLLALTTSASAECAWVLGSFHWEEGTGFERYDVTLAYESRRECEAELASTSAKSLKDLGFEVKGDSPESREVYATKGNRHWRFFCFPDTVDPRGPKGK